MTNCPKCNQRVAPKWKKCLNCGAVLAPPPARPVPLPAGHAEPEPAPPSRKPPAAPDSEGVLEWNFPLLAGAATIAAGVLLGALWSAVMLDKTSYLTLLRDLYGGASGTRIEPEFASILSALFLRNVIASLAAIAVGLLHRWLSASLEDARPRYQRTYPR